MTWDDDKAQVQKELVDTLLARGFRKHARRRFSRVDATGNVQALDFGSMRGTRAVRMIDFTVMATLDHAPVVELWTAVWDEEVMAIRGRKPKGILNCRCGVHGVDMDEHDDRSVARLVDEVFSRAEPFWARAHSPEAVVAEERKGPMHEVLAPAGRHITLPIYALVIGATRDATDCAREHDRQTRIRIDESSPPSTDPDSWETLKRSNALERADRYRAWVERLFAEAGANFDGWR